MKLPMLTLDDKLAEIKRLYYQTTRPTIEQDLVKALDLLRSMASEEERDRAAVYMDGLSQMRSDWRREAKQKAPRKGVGAKASGAARPGASSPGARTGRAKTTRTSPAKNPGTPRRK